MRKQSETEQTKLSKIICEANSGEIEPLILYIFLDSVPAQP